MFVLTNDTISPDSILINETLAVRPATLRRDQAHFNSEGLRHVIPLLNKAMMLIALERGIVIAGEAAIHEAPANYSSLTGVSHEPENIKIELQSSNPDDPVLIMAAEAMQELSHTKYGDALTIEAMPSAFNFHELNMTEAYSLNVNGIKASGYRLTADGAVLRSLEKAAANQMVDFDDAELVQIGVQHGCLQDKSVRNLVSVIHEANLPKENKISMLLDLESLHKKVTTLTKGNCEARIYWHNQPIGNVIMSHRKRLSVNFENQIIQERLANESLEKRSATPSFLAQMLPGKSGDDRQTLMATMRHGMHGLGNVTVGDPTLPQRSIDKKGMSIEALIKDNVYTGVIYNVTRPSLLTSPVKREPFEHQQWNVDRDELVLSGNQPKTTVHLRPSPTGMEIHHSSVSNNDPATHLLKMPPEAYGEKSAFGAREWMTMRLVRAMGLDVPEFAMVDLNKTSRQYIRGLDQKDDELNLTTTLMKRNLFEGLTSNNQRVKLLSDDERSHGEVIEPPGFMIERFDLPEAHEENVRIMGIEFCALAGIDSGQKFEGEIEDIAKLLRAHSTDFEQDRVALFKRVAASWLVADGDMHMKNVSMLMREEKGMIHCTMSPAYDVLSMTGLSGFSVRSALLLNGTHEPEREDLITFATAHLDIAPKDAEMILEDMAQKCLIELTRFRGATQVDEPSNFKWPDMVERHKFTRASLINMTHGIEMCLVARRVLKPEQEQAISERVAQENERVFNESTENIFSDAFRPSHN